MFATEIERCGRCGGKLCVIASLSEPALIERIPASVRWGTEADEQRTPFAARAPPQPRLL